MLASKADELASTNQRERYVMYYYMHIMRIRITYEQLHITKYSICMHVLHIRIYVHMCGCTNAV